MRDPYLIAHTDYLDSLERFVTQKQLRPYRPNSQVSLGPQLRAMTVVVATLMVLVVLIS